MGQKYIRGLAHSPGNVELLLNGDTIFLCLSLVPGGRYTVFPSGELHVRKVDPGTDSHRKYSCQAKHRLTGKVYRSFTVARLIIIGEPHTL